MGLFDKRDTRKKPDAFDSPVETIDLNAPPEEPEITVTSGSIGDAEPAEAGADPAAAAPEADDDDEPADYGIERAIELMRTLPQDNVELVVQVVKHTLESTKIKISGIIDDAARKQDDIQGRIKVLKDEIAEYEQEIATRKDEITSLEEDHEETSTVKERLVLAEKLTKEQAAAAAGKSAKRDDGKSGRTKTPTEPPPPPKSAGDSPRPKSSTEPPPGQGKASSSSGKPPSSAAKK